MINLVKLFTVVVVVTSLVVVSVGVCESTKTDFTLKNVFRLFNETKFVKKFKKDVKHDKDKDKKVTDLYEVAESNRRDIAVPTPLIHTLIPLPLPVHLPIPGTPEAESPLLPPPMPQVLPRLPLMPPPHFHPYPYPHYHPSRPSKSNPKAEESRKSWRSVPPKPKDKQSHRYHRHHLHQHNYDHHGHDHHHDHDDHHHHHSPSPGHLQYLDAIDPMSPMVAEASTVFMSPVAPPPVLLHPHIDIPLPAMPIPPPLADGIAVPVFELIEADPKANEVHPNAHSYGRETDDSIGTNVNIDSNHKKTRDSGKRVNRERDRQTDQQKSSESMRSSKGIEKEVQTSRSVKLVSKDKFNTIHGIPGSDNYGSHKVRNTEGKANNRRDESNPRRGSASSRTEDMKPMSSDQRWGQKAIPDEQTIDLSEDEWTFKDLDLWLVK